MIRPRSIRKNQEHRTFSWIRIFSSQLGGKMRVDGDLPPPRTLAEGCTDWHRECIRDERTCALTKGYTHQGTPLIERTVARTVQYNIFYWSDVQYHAQYIQYAVYNSTYSTYSTRCTVAPTVHVHTVSGVHLQSGVVQANWYCRWRHPMHSRRRTGGTYVHEIHVLSLEKLSRPRMRKSCSHCHISCPVLKYSVLSAPRPGLHVGRENISTHGRIVASWPYKWYKSLEYSCYKETEVFKTEKILT